MANRDSQVYYGICKDNSNVEKKTVEIQNPIIENGVIDLAIGDVLVVKFDKGNTAPSPVISITTNEVSDGTPDVSADSGLRILINDLYEVYDWEPQDLVAFVCVNIGQETGVNGSDESVKTYAWKPIDFRIASEDAYGITKLVNDESELEENDERPVSYEIIKNKIDNLANNLGLTYSNGTLTLIFPEGYNSKSVSIPVPPTRTSQLTNNGSDGNGVYWSSNSNNYVNSTAYGIGYQYTGTDSKKHVIRSIVPYGTITSDGVESHAIRIGRDALEAYQLGTKNSSGQLIEKDPYLRLYGNKIDLMIDDGGQVRIGDVDIPRDTYNPWYIFTANQALFNKRLIAKELVVDSSLVYKGRELENRLTNFYYGQFFTEPITLSAHSAAAKNSDDNRTLEITRTRDGYVPIAIIGYNMNSSGEQVHYINMWECYIKSKNNKYYIHYGVYNFGDSKYTFEIKFDVLFVKKGLWDTI